MSMTYYVAHSFYNLLINVNTAVTPVKSGLFMWQGTHTFLADMTTNRGFLLLFLVLSTGYFSRTQGDDRCEVGWHYYGGKCYYREDDNHATWTNALLDCQSKQAILVTVNNANEQAFLNGLMGDFGSWIGLHDREEEGAYEWVGDEQSSYTNWAPNQPSTNINRRCAKIRFPSDYKWVKRNCNRLYKYTCEKAQSDKWVDYTPQWCGAANRRRIQSGMITVEECKQRCPDCAAIEYWAGKTGSCFECLDYTKRGPYANTGDPYYPPHVYVRQ